MKVKNKIELSRIDMSKPINVLLNGAVHAVLSFKVVNAADKVNLANNQCLSITILNDQYVKLVFRNKKISVRYCHISAVESFVPLKDLEQE